MVLAWTTAILGRAKDVPALDSLIGRDRRTPAEATAELHASMQAYRQVATERGQVRSWKEWLH
nr:hypothetical protein [Gemmobacter sp.]